MDCRTCKHNTYIDIKNCSHVCCCHPVTIKKAVRWEKGDPAMVNFRTSDVPLRDIGYFQDCPAYEAAAQVNLPWERVPQHAGDPGHGPVPPVRLPHKDDNTPAI
jgi:hypothetical protein